MKLVNRLGAAGVIVLLSLCSTASAERTSMNQVNDRIRRLRARLESVRSNLFNRKGRNQSENENQSTLEMSEELEQRKDAKVIILFHDPQPNKPTQKPLQNKIDDDSGRAPVQKYREDAPRFQKNYRKNPVEGSIPRPSVDSRDLKQYWAWRLGKV